MRIAIRLPNHFTVGECKEVIEFTLAQADRQARLREARKADRKDFERIRKADEKADAIAEAGAAR